MNTKEPAYSCVMIPPKTHVLKSQTVTVKGDLIKLPSLYLFIHEDGSVYVQTKREGDHVEYVSLKSLIEAVKNTQVIESFSE